MKKLAVAILAVLLGSGLLFWRSARQGADVSNLLDERGSIELVEAVGPSVSAKVISYEKEIVNGNANIKVITEYTYPDNTKKLGTTRYNYNNFSKNKVLVDVKTHCETITKYYIEGNQEKMVDKANKIVDNLIIEQNSLPIDSIDKITNIVHSINSVYIKNLDLTLNADGVIKDIYK